MAFAVIILVWAFVISFVLSILLEGDEIDCLPENEVSIAIVNGRKCTVYVTNDHRIDSTIEPFNFKSFVLDKKDFENRQMLFRCAEEE